MKFALDELRGIMYSLIKSYLVFAAIIIIWLLYQCFKNHMLSKLWKVDLKSKYGSWAVVTGCTDGIGKAYSCELAKRGLNLILVSRTLSKLESVASEIRNKYKVKTEVIQVDFSHGNEIYTVLEEKLRDRNIGILVNNVGVAQDGPKPFEYVTQEDILSYINVNMAAPTFLTSIILPIMIKNQKGAIINISSLASMNPSPYNGIYSATKAYNYYFSQALKLELQQKGIFVQTVTPSFIATTLTKYSDYLSKKYFWNPSPDIFAVDAVSTIGYANITCGFIIHELLSVVFYILPQWVLMKATELMYKFLVPNININTNKNNDLKVNKPHSL